jgi:DNA-directed RNA polymerase subunit RPC12/RpoP
MWTNLTQVGVLCEASDRDSEPAGQLPDHTRPPFGSAESPEGHPASTPRGAGATGGVDGREPIQTDRRPAPSPTYPRATVRCTHCGARLRWTGRRSARVRCPKCRLRLVLRLGPDGKWAVLPENDDSVAGMICDWLGNRNHDEAEQP